MRNLGIRLISAERFAKRDRVLSRCTLMVRSHGYRYEYLLRAPCRDQLQRLIQGMTILAKTSTAIHSTSRNR